MPTVLVAYETRNGGTRALAQAVARGFSGRGFEARVRSVDENPELSGLDAVVLGSRFSFGRAGKSFCEFLTRNRNALRALPHALFFAPLMLIRPADTNEAAPLLSPSIPGTGVGEGRFLNMVEQAFSMEAAMKTLASLPLSPPDTALIRGGFAPDALPLAQKLKALCLMLLLEQIDPETGPDTEFAEQWSLTLFPGLGAP